MSSLFIIIDPIINEIININICQDYRILKTIVPCNAIMQISQGYRGLLDYGIINYMQNSLHSLKKN